MIYVKKGLLPIGTVVLLEGGTRKVMICGYSSKSEDDEKVYDYNGCIFPEGFLENIYLLFNHDQIDDICFVGYKDDDYEEYVNNGASEMRAKYTTEKISGRQTKKFDLSTLDKK